MKVNLIDVWRRLRDVDKRRLEGKVALNFWREVWWDITKIALPGTFLLLVAMSLSGLMPAGLHDLASILRSMYADASGGDFILSGGLGGVSISSIALNLYGLRKDLDLLDQTLRIAERTALKRSASR